jgi:hypothetical protein
MMFAPYINPGEFEMTVPPNAQPPVDMTMGGMMQVISQPHVTFAGTIVGLLALKFFTESNLLSLDVAEVKVSLYNILAISLQAGIGIVGIKVFAGWLLQRGVMVPGFADFVGAL